MDITLDKSSTTEGKIKVKLLPADYQPQVDEKVTDYRKKANLKGFRPGKVPASVIRQMYGKSILVEEVNRALSKGLTDYIRENDLNVVGEPLPDEDSIKDITWEENSEFDFVYDVGLYSDFEVNLSKVSGVTAYEVEVKDKEVEEMIDDLRTQNGESSNPEVSEAGDSLYGTVTNPNDAAFEHTGLLDMEKLPKKEQKAFVGAKADDAIEFVMEKAFPKAADRAEFLGVLEKDAEEITGTFVFTVKNVNRSIPAELDQAFFDRMFGEGQVATEEEFRTKVQETMNGNYNQEAQSLLRTQVRDAIVDQVEIELPEAFLKRWIIATNDQELTEEQIEQDFPHYIKDLKWNLISTHLAKENEIKVEHTDVVESTKNMIRAQFGGSGMSAIPQLEDSLDDFANNYLQGENGDNYMRVFNQVRAEKIMDMAMDQVKTKSKKVTLEKFKEAVAN